MKLTERRIKTLGPGRYTDDQVRGLTLLVQRTGGRSWVQRIVIAGQRIDRGLGGWPDVALQTAREIAQRNRTEVVLSGRTVDPFAKRERQARTFADAETATLGAHRDSWSPASIKSWMATMRNHVLPKLGTVHLASLTRQHVIDCLKSIKSVAEARKAKQRIRTVMELALSRDWATENPAANGGLDAALPHLRKHAGDHHEAAPYAAVGAILRRLSDVASGAVVLACFRFVVLTATRSAEARGAEWSEIDVAGKVWTIPAARMKANREHRIPLSDAAVAILRERQGEHKRYVFASERTNKVLSSEALRRVVLAVGAGTLHGFRSSFRDWASDTNKDREAAEHALAHTVGSTVERSYARSDLFERRRKLMDAWADYITG